MPLGLPNPVLTALGPYTASSLCIPRGLLSVASIEHSPAQCPWDLRAEETAAAELIDGALGTSLSKSQAWLCSSSLLLLLLCDVRGQVAEPQGSHAEERRKLCPGIARFWQPMRPVPG